MKNVLVAGADGFIGSNFTELLVQNFSEEKFKENYFQLIEKITYA